MFKVPKLSFMVRKWKTGRYLRASVITDSQHVKIAFLNHKCKFASMTFCLWIWMSFESIVKVKVCHPFTTKALYEKIIGDQTSK